MESEIPEPLHQGLDLEALAPAQRRLGPAAGVPGQGARSHPELPASREAEGALEEPGSGGRGGLHGGAQGVHVLDEASPRERLPQRGAEAPVVGGPEHLDRRCLGDQGPRLPQPAQRVGGRAPGDPDVATEVTSLLVEHLIPRLQESLKPGAKAGDALAGGRGGRGVAGVGQLQLGVEVPEPQTRRHVLSALCLSSTKWGSKLTLVEGLDARLEVGQERTCQPHSFPRSCRASSPCTISLLSATFSSFSPRSSRQDPRLSQGLSRGQDPATSRLRGRRSTLHFARLAGSPGHGADPRSASVF